MIDVSRILDVIVFLFIVGFLLILDYGRRQGLSKEEREKFEDLINDISERNLTAMVATRVLQGGLTIGGFLFAGSFGAIFQSALKLYAVDIFIIIIWAWLSLFVGFINLAWLPQRAIVENIAISRFYVILTIVQLSAILSGFVRVFLLIVRYQGWI